MPRTPKPETTKLQSYRFEAANYEYLANESQRLGLPWGHVLNQELQFLRTAGLPPYLEFLFQHEVARLKSTVRQEFMATLWQAAMGLPRYHRPLPALPPSREAPSHLTSVNMTGPNRTYLLERARETGQDFTTVLNGELHFARTLGLNLKLQAALAEHLQRTRQSPREWATTEMYERVIPLKNQQIAEQGIPTRRQE